MKYRYFRWISGIVALSAIILIFVWRANMECGQSGGNDDEISSRLISIDTKDQNHLSDKIKSGKRPRTWRRETPKVHTPVESHFNEHQLFNFDGILDSDAAKKLGLTSDQIVSIEEVIGQIEDDIVEDFFNNATQETIGDGEEILVHGGSNERAKELSDRFEASILMALHDSPLKDRILADILSGMKNLRCLNFGEGDMLGIRVMASGADKEDSGKLRTASAWRVCLKPKGYIEHSRKFGWPSKDLLLISNGYPIEVWEED